MSYGNFTTPATLADVSAPSSTTNKLYSNAGVLFWNGSAVGSAPGSGTFTVFDGMKPPASASAYDDEFDATTLDAKWTTVNWAGLNSYDVNTTAYSCLYTSNPSSTTETFRAILQAIPAGDFTIWTRVNMPLGLEFALAGLLLSSTNTTATGTQTVVALTYNKTNAPDNGFVVGVGNYSNFGTFSAGQFACNLQDSTVYIRIRRSSTTYYAGLSADGKTWAEKSFTPSGTPAYFGLFVDNKSTSWDQPASFEFFRYNSSATATLGGTRTIVNA